MLWGLGVGYVISGMYFGWNLGLPQGGPFGLLIATLLVTLMYGAFVFSYAELACAIPKAGGAFDYAHQAFGPRLGFLAGIAQWVEFVFAPPAIAWAIGAYFNIFYPNLSPLLIAFIAYALFTGLNIYGVKQSAVFELIITIVAVVELLIFCGLTLPNFSWTEFSRNPLPHGWAGILPAIPFAIWFYLGIEGIANVAEETLQPQRDIVRGFGWAMFTLAGLALLVFFSATGVAGWEAIVYVPGTTETTDKPLPLALGKVMGESHPFYHLLVIIGLTGLLASFHGLILAAGRATFEFGRLGYAPRMLAHILPNRQTPAIALIANTCVGFVTLLIFQTDKIITLSVFGALTLYALSMIAFFRLRTTAPQLARPFVVPLYPWFPGTALVLAVVCLGAVAYSDYQMGMIYLAIVGASFGWFYLAIPKHIRDREEAQRA